MLQNWRHLNRLMVRVLFLALGIAVFGITSSAQENFHRTEKLMGCRFDLTVVADNASEGETYLNMASQEITRIERLISSWDESSQTSAINRNAGLEPVIVNQELFDFIARCIRLSELTSGAFDISYASMDRIWKYDGTMTEMPTAESVKSSVDKVGYQKILLNEKDHSVFLPIQGMQIGFGAVGKGYAADKAKELLLEQGVSSAIINASGDLNAWGKQADDSEWMVAITNPLNKAKAFAWLPVENSAVVTSGNYEKFVLINDKKYSHIIDPRSGYPSEGISSVTIFAPKAELADALATSVFITGVEVGLDMINQLPGVECVIVDSDNSIHTSENLKLNHEKN